MRAGKNSLKILVHRELKLLAPRGLRMREVLAEMVATRQMVIQAQASGIVNLSPVSATHCRSLSVSFTRSAR